MHDVIIIGGGPAGLQAALTLGRMHRSTLLLDSGEYRNAAASHMHNVAGHDGTPPAEYRAQVRRELEAYESVEVREARVREVGGTIDDFTVTLEDGTTLPTRRLLLATGVRDVLPEIPGVAELWGELVHHCPFCHGHELAGRRIGLVDNPHAEMLAGMLRAISPQVQVIDVPTSVERRGEAVVAATAGGEVELDGLFVQAPFVQSAPFADQLGLEILESGCIAVDPFGATSVPGVAAAGDFAHLRELPMPMPTVLSAASAGLSAASTLVRELAATPQPA